MQTEEWRITTNFLSETMQAKGIYKGNLKVIQEKHETRILYPAKYLSKEKVKCSMFKPIQEILLPVDVNCKKCEMKFFRQKEYKKDTWFYKV